MDTNRYFYRIKIPTTTKRSHGTEWDRKPFDIGCVEAPSKAEAKKLLEEQFDSPMCQRSKRDDIGTKNLFMVQIYKMDEALENLWNSTHTCRVCGAQYTNLQRDKAHDFAHISGDVCSQLCEGEIARNDQGANNG